MKKDVLADILELPVSERILLVEDIWESIARAPEAVSLTEGQREELEKRLEAYHRDPEAGSPWPEVKARLRKS